MLLQWMKVISNIHRIDYPLMYNSIVNVYFGWESVYSGNGWTAHPCLQDIQKDHCYLYIGQFQTALNSDDPNYKVHILILGY